MKSILRNRQIKSKLPPGPASSTLWQSLATWQRPTASLELARKRYGKRFTIQFLGQPPFVILSDPQEIKELFQSAPEVLHPGEGARVLEPIVGPNSVILLDEAPHLRQRKLLLPAFHGERVQALAGLMAELTDRELDSWPLDEPGSLHPRLQRLTLEIVLRAAFGLEQGAKLDRLRELLTGILAFAESPLSLMPFAQRWLAGRGPVGRLERLGEETDRLIYELIEERRAEDHGDSTDVLGLLLSARDEDGSPMGAQELRDELVTALVAGHETTASQLAWGLELLARHPHVLGRLAAECANDPDDDAYLTATIHEIMRRRPVLINAEPRLVKQPVRIGGFDYPPGVVLVANAYLVHHDPEIYPDPYSFRPERFLDQSPGTYTWLAFGGGRRRCLGASFAMLEMKIVLRAVVQRYALLPQGNRPEVPRRRSITISPSRGCELILRERARPAQSPSSNDASISRSASEKIATPAGSA